MRVANVLPRPLLMAGGATLLLGVTALASVIARDLAKQLELIEAGQGKAAVVYGQIERADRVDLPGGEVPFTRLTVKVEQSLLPEGKVGDQVVAYTAGYGDERLSISPPETELRAGERVVLFLRMDAEFQELTPPGYKLDSYAEVFRTQKNRKGQVVVLGEGAGSAIPANEILADLSVRAAEAYTALKGEKK